MYLMNQQLQQAYEELQQQVGQLQLYSDYEDWAEVVLDEEVTGQSNEFVLVTDPQKYATTADRHLLQDLWLEQYSEQAADTARTLYAENATGRWQMLLDELVDEDSVSRDYAIESIVNFHYGVDIEDNSDNVLGVLAEYADEHPEYSAEGLRKPKQKRKKRWRGDQNPPLIGPSEEDWTQMTMAEKLWAADAGRSTAANIRWGRKAWRAVLAARIATGDPKLLGDPDFGWQYSDYLIDNMSVADLIDAVGTDNVFDLNWERDVAEILAEMSADEIFEFTEVDRYDIKQLPSGAYYWEETW